MVSLLQQAVAYIRAGDIEKGRQLLIEVLKQNPRDEDAWLWMTTCVTEPDRKRYCFNRVLKINPQNQHAITGLRRLDNPRVDTEGRSSAILFSAHSKENSHHLTLC